MKNFEYLSPESIEEAIALMERYKEKAKYIAGGTDVIVKIKEEKLFCDYLISLKKIDFLKILESDDKTKDLYIGAGVTHRRLEKSALIKSDYPILHDAVTNIGSLQIRNAATIGGNIVNAVPSADGAIPLIAMDGIAEIRGVNGEKKVNLTDFFTGPGENILNGTEILTRIIIPKQEPNTSGAYVKFGRRAAMELPLLGVGTVLSLDDDLKKCIKARICLGVAAPVPMRANKAEDFLTGREIEEQSLEKAGEIAAEESKVRDSVRGAAWYRREMVKVQIKRTALKSIKRIKQKSGR